MHRIGNGVNSHYHQVIVGLLKNQHAVTFDKIENMLLHCPHECRDVITKYVALYHQQRTMFVLFAVMEVLTTEQAVCSLILFFL